MNITSQLCIFASVAVAYPVYGYYPNYGSVGQSSYHNSGAYDNGAVSSANLYGTGNMAWNNGYASSEQSSLLPYGNAGSSSTSQWSSNAWSNRYNGGYW